MHYVLYDLGCNQEIQEKLYKEISSILSQNKLIKKKDIIQMKLLKNVVKESMR